MSDDKHFSPERIFILLFVLTALEVLWGYMGGVWWDWGKLMLWGGLLFFAFFKGWLIAVYFMHLKFEGWVVKSLILPTPFLIGVIFFYVLPDVADKQAPLVYPVGSMLEPDSGAVYRNMGDYPDPHHEEGGESDSESH